MKVTPPAPAYLPGQKPKRQYSPPDKGDMLRRYANMNQALFDALVPFVDSYESCYFESQHHLSGKTKVTIVVSLDDIRRAQLTINPSVEIIV